MCLMILNYYVFCKIAFVLFNIFGIIKIHMQTKTAEFVSPGHPDKICDFIADSILDAYLAEDKESRVAIEVMGGHKLITINGEVTSTNKLNLETIVKKIVGENYKIIVNIEGEGNLRIHILPCFFFI